MVPLFGAPEDPLPTACSDIVFWYHAPMNSRHRKTLEAIFANPVNGNLEWRRIEALFLALGAEIHEGNGSRVMYVLNGEKFDVHRPHPGKEALKYRVKNARHFLENAGITP